MEIFKIFENFENFENMTSHLMVAKWNWWRQKKEKFLRKFVKNGVGQHTCQVLSSK